MNLHANAVLTVRQRRCLVELVSAGWTISAAAERVGCSRQTGSKWVARARRGEGLLDRSSRPHRSPRRCSGSLELAILAKRAELHEGPHSVAFALGLPASTVHAVLRRHGRSRLVVREKPEPVIRYERDRPGELVHIDIKKLGRIVQPGHRVTGDRSRRARGKAGWQYLFVCIDDHSRLAHAAIYPDETATSAISFIDECRAFYTQHGIRIERVLTDNGSCFKNRWRDHLTHHAITPKRTRPYRPQTNGKAERFIQSALREWAYGFTYQHSSERTKALDRWNHHYNWHRPHQGIGGAVPMSRLISSRNNLLTLHI